MKKYSIVVYSHSSYSDAWKIILGQIDKYFPQEVNRYIFSDSFPLDLSELYNKIKYLNENAYNKRVLSCLDKVKEDYCIFHQEDMPLYSEPDLQFLDRTIELMEKDNIDYVKLIKGGNIWCKEKPYKDFKNLFHMPKNGDCYYSNQPSLCRTKSLKKLFSMCDVEKIHDFEPKAHKMALILDFKNLYYYNNEPMRGEFHWDSKVYPYVATAIVKGKWNYSEYGAELQKLHKQYGIDPDIRGIT